MNCKNCGAELTENTASCAYCGTPVAAESETIQPVEAVEIPEVPNTTLPPEQPQKPENMITGIIGAIAGALLGGFSIILLDQLGFVASLSGFLIAFLSLKGYEWLGGRLTKKGIITSIVLCALVPILSYFMSIAFYWTKDVPYPSLGEAFAWVLESALYIEFWQQIGLSLLMLYGFTALGAYSTISNAIKKSKQ